MTNYNPSVFHVTITPRPSRLGRAARLTILTLLLALTLAGCGSDGDALRAQRPKVTATPSGGSAAQVAPIPTPVDEPPADLTPPPTGDELSGLSTEMQLDLAIVPVRDLRELALRINPEYDEIPVVVNDESPVYQIGDRQAFWAHNLDSNSAFTLTAELVYETGAAHVWVQVKGDEPDYDADEVQASIGRFSEVSYPAEVALFGGEWNPGVDDDPRLHVLHALGLGGSVAGYYSSADEYSKLANPFSNEKEMFYINLDWLNRTQDYDFYETVLAHEFQHMIHWYRDRNEETWLNEGLSEFAQEVAGYDPDTVFARTFADEPDTQLNDWRETSQPNDVHYGSAYLFVSYLNQRFGPELIRALVAHPANGMGGLDAVLQAAGLDLAADDVFADWVIANYADDPNALGLNGIYGYQNLAQAPPRLEATIDAYPAKIGPTTVHNYAADYYLFKGDGDVTVDFSGATHTRLAATDPYSGEQMWWGNRGDDSDSRLTRSFDFSQVDASQPLTLTASMWRDIEIDYDYGYVLASRDGETWETLQNQHTTRENPSGNSFGDAFTGPSSEDPTGPAQWVTEEFDLSDYAGEEAVWLRFEYVTDDAVTKSGWFVDDLAIPAIDYATDFENGPDGWESEGWLLMDNDLRQSWLIQVMEFEDNRLTAVRRIPVDDQGKATFTIEGLGKDRTAALAVSALAPVTTEPATYSFTATEATSD
jgi:uncharacterized lipoprotein YmbA